MTAKSVVTALLTACCCIMLALPAGAHGDKVIPQVADGTGGDLQYRTKFDLTNLGPYQETAIAKTKLLFFRPGGGAWTVPYKIGTAQGNASEINITLDAFQTVRIETLGTSSPLASGYAVLRSNEPTGVASRFAEDYEIGITVYYEILQNGRIVDTVSVPIGQPTFAFMLPVESAESQRLYSGLAIVNLDSLATTVTLDLYTTLPSRNADGSARPAQTSELNLQPGEQWTGFLGGGIFPNAKEFRGMLFGRSVGPVALLGLLQTPTQPSGVQYATLVPAYRDYLRRNSFVYLQQGFPLDADLIVSDYFLNADDKDPWDLLYETVDTTRRRLLPQEGARIAIVGFMKANDFHNLKIENLRELTYGSTAIDLSDNSDNLQKDFTFAIRTGLGRYVKLRINGWAITGLAGEERDLQLQVYTYR